MNSAAKKRKKEISVKVTTSKTNVKDCLMVAMKHVKLIKLRLSKKVNLKIKCHRLSLLLIQNQYKSQINVLKCALAWKGG